MILFWIGIVCGLITGSVASLLLCLIALGKKMKKKELEQVKAERENAKDTSDISA